MANSKFSTHPPMTNLVTINSRYIFILKRPIGDEKTSFIGEDYKGHFQKNCACKKLFYIKKGSLLIVSKPPLLLKFISNNNVYYLRKFGLNVIITYAQLLV